MCAPLFQLTVENLPICLRQVITREICFSYFIICCAGLDLSHLLLSDRSSETEACIFTSPLIKCKHRNAVTLQMSREAHSVSSTVLVVCSDIVGTLLSSSLARITKQVLMHNVWRNMRTLKALTIDYSEGNMCSLLEAVQCRADPCFFTFLPYVSNALQPPHKR